MSTLLALRQRVSQTSTAAQGSVGSRPSSYASSPHHKGQNGGTHVSSPLSEPGDEAPSLFPVSAPRSSGSKVTHRSASLPSDEVIPSPPAMPAPKLFLTALAAESPEPKEAPREQGASSQYADRYRPQAKKYGPKGAAKSVPNQSVSNTKDMIEKSLRAQHGTSFLAAQAAERRAMYRIKDTGSENSFSERGKVSPNAEPQQEHNEIDGHVNSIKTSPSVLDRSDSEGSVMEQNLELLAQSLRGDQEEAEGVRKGLMMLQPFEVEDAAPSTQSSPHKGSGVQSSSSTMTDDSIKEITPHRPHSPIKESSAHQSHSPVQNSHLAARKASEVGHCPSDYLHHIAHIENAVLREDMSPNTWVSGVGITATCIQRWTARSNNEISLEESEYVDMSFFDAGAGSDWWFGIRVGRAASRIWNLPEDLPLLRKESGYFPSHCVKLVHPRKKSLTRDTSHAAGHKHHHHGQHDHHHQHHQHHHHQQQQHEEPAPSLSHLNDYFEGQKPLAIDDELQPVQEVPMWRPPGSPEEVAGQQLLHRRLLEDFTESTLPVVTSASDHTDSLSSADELLHERHEAVGGAGTPSLADLLHAANAAVASRAALSPGGGVAVDPAVLWALGGLSGISGGSQAGSEAETSVQCRVLMHHVRQGNVGAVQRALGDKLIAVNDALDARTRDTALHAAAANGKDKMVAFLLEHGADPSALNAYGQRPADKASIFGFKDIAARLHHPDGGSERPQPAAPPPSTPAAPAPPTPPPAPNVTCCQYFLYGPAAILPPEPSPAQPQPQPPSQPEPAASTAATPGSAPATGWRRRFGRKDAARSGKRAGCCSCFRPAPPEASSAPMALPAAHAKPLSGAESGAASVGGASAGSGRQGSPRGRPLVHAAAVEVRLPAATPIAAGEDSSGAARAPLRHEARPTLNPSPLPVRPPSASGAFEHGAMWREGWEGAQGARSQGSLRGEEWAGRSQGSLRGGDEEEAYALSVERQLLTIDSLASLDGSAAPSRDQPPAISQAGLPSGWEARWDSLHRMPYYINHIERTTTWHHPNPNPNSPPAGSTAFLSPRNITPLNTSTVGAATITDLRVQA